MGESAYYGLPSGDLSVPGPSRNLTLGSIAEQGKACDKDG